MRIKVKNIFSSFLFLLVIIGCSEITSPVDDKSPNTPSNFILIGGGDGQAYFRWEKNIEPDLKEYRLYKSEYTPKVFTLLASTTQTEYVDRFLAYDSTYFYYLTAIDYAGNESDPTSIIDVQPLNTSAPQPPSRLIVSGYNNPQQGLLEMQLSWVPPDIGDLKNYLVYRGTDSLFIPDVATFINTTSIAVYTDRFVEINKKYFYKIIAVDKGDKASFPSKTNSDIVLISPSLVSPANNTKFGNPRTFKWESVPAAYEYKVFVGNGPFSDVVWSSQSTKKTEVTFNGPALQTSKIYYWWVGTYSREKIKFDDNSELPAQINSYSLSYSFFVE